MSASQRLDTTALSLLRGVLSSEMRLVGLLAPLEPTNKLARVLAGGGASFIETSSCSSDMPHEGLFPHCSRGTSGAQVDKPGGTLYATPPLSC